MLSTILDSAFCYWFGIRMLAEKMAAILTPLQCPLMEWSKSEGTAQGLRQFKMVSFTLAWCQHACRKKWLNISLFGKK